jgi:hypothetical protein
VNRHGERITFDVIKVADILALEVTTNVERSLLLPLVCDAEHSMKRRTTSAVPSSGGSSPIQDDQIRLQENLCDPG